MDDASVGGDVADSGDTTTNGRVVVVDVVAMAEEKAWMLCVWLLANENPVSTFHEQTRTVYMEIVLTRRRSSGFNDALE